MPKPIDHRDHPEHYSEGNFAMDRAALERRLPANAHLHIGLLSDTVPAFIERLSVDSPLGFVSIDVDYYSSALDALKIFTGPPERYLPVVDVYLDDVIHESHNAWCGELRALAEFNEEHALRKIAPHTFLARRRLFTRASWIDQMFSAHILDHPSRTVSGARVKQRALQNVYFP